MSSSLTELAKIFLEAYRAPGASLEHRVAAQVIEAFMHIFEQHDTQAARIEQLEGNALRATREGAQFIAERDELYAALRSIHRVTTDFDCTHGSGRYAECACCRIRDVLDQVAKDTSFNPAEQAIENCPPRDIRHSRCLHPEACESALGAYCAKCHQALYP